MIKVNQLQLRDPDHVGGTHLGSSVPSETRSALRDPVFVTGTTKAVGPLLLFIYLFIFMHNELMAALCSHLPPAVKTVEVVTNKCKYLTCYSNILCI